MNDSSEESSDEALDYYFDSISEISDLSDVDDTLHIRVFLLLSFELFFMFLTLSPITIVQSQFQTYIFIRR